MIIFIKVYHLQMDVSAQSQICYQLKTVVKCRKYFGIIIEQE